MSEENLAPEGETVAAEMRVQLASAEDGVNITDAKTLRLTVEGESRIVQAAFEIVMGFLQVALGGEIARAEDSEGEDITDQFRTPVIDPLDLGDDPVA